MSVDRYDSRPDTWEHIATVRRMLSAVIGDLLLRADRHDLSKLEEPELSLFDEFTPKLRATTYGSAEYERYREAMGEALEHHYLVNSHHPEHFAAGILGMTLTDLVEMLCDWKAATMRHDDGDLRRSISEVNKRRFGYGDEIEHLLLNTAEAMGWLQ